MLMKVQEYVESTFSNILKLQDKLDILLKQNEGDYNELKKYFAKFEESSSFSKSTLI